MLRRPPHPPPNPGPDEHRRARRRQEQRRYRANHKAGIRFTRVAIDGDVISWLQAEYPGRCSPDDLVDIGRLIAAILKASARK
ncbi:hypothetical protein QA639_25470 [Bradyrhizobium pachyrhizi]|uniref:hypothetical protein n=1 Tax=Bradyrhizobium pachyrhizi TaxID=280333 RepID=UPI0024B16C3E|nr:hypothetical protein [Bradyrhizobium pachyrhizi]WFU53025.1 hypothetical protein QA639_25470 [Bradyrhizobium pachyrhizi]